MGAGATTQRQMVNDFRQNQLDKMMKASTDAEKLALFNELQIKLKSGSKPSKSDERHKAASKLQARQRGKMARSVARGGDDLKAVFRKFATFGKSKRQAGSGDAIDSSRFRKMLKESKVICKKFNNTDSDMTHTSCKTKGQKTLTFDEFLNKALPKIAAKLGVEEGEVAFKISNGGPQNSGTKAEYSKFYDDKKTWTGVATRGGPSTSGDQITLSGMMDRSGADARGVGSNSGRA